MGSFVLVGRGVLVGSCGEATDRSSSSSSVTSPIMEIRTIKPITTPIEMATHFNARRRVDRGRWFPCRCSGPFPFVGNWLVTSCGVNGLGSADGGVSRFRRSLLISASWLFLPTERTETSCVVILMAAELAIHLVILPMCNVPLSPQSGGYHGLQDAAIGIAAAKVAGEGSAPRMSASLGYGLASNRARADSRKPGGAEAALSAVLGEALEG